MSDRKCKRCGKIIPMQLRLNNKKYNLKNRTNCLECVPFKTERQSANENSPKTITKSCSKHGVIEHVLESRTSGYRYRCSICLKGYTKSRVQAVADQRKRNKIKYVEYLGGKCSVCGYNKCMEALDFHHKDPTKKEHAICDGRTRSFEKAKIELDKCVLLCANCHREVHNL